MFVCVCSVIFSWYLFFISDTESRGKEGVCVSMEMMICLARSTLLKIQQPLCCPT